MAQRNVGVCGVTECDGRVGRGGNLVKQRSPPARASQLPQKFVPHSPPSVARRALCDGKSKAQQRARWRHLTKPTRFDDPLRASKYCQWASIWASPAAVTTVGINALAQLSVQLFELPHVPGNEVNGTTRPRQRNRRQGGAELAENHDLSLVRACVRAHQLTSTLETP